MSIENLYSQHLSSKSNQVNDGINFSSYKLEQIGESSNSCIFSITNKNKQSQILKVIKHNSQNSYKLEGREQCSGHSRECAHLQNEYNMLRKLNHPNIIELKHDQLIQNTSIVDTNINGCCILLEKGNCDLLQMLSQVYPNVLEMSYLKYCFKKIAFAIQYLHEEKKIAHNDIKLENIILFNSEPKISDFGFAQKHELDPIVQIKNWLHRSKKNVAPEIINNMKKLKAKQIDDIKAFDERKTDIFALGIALFNALIHQNPFEIMADSNDSLYSKFYEQDGASKFWSDPQISRMLDFISSFEHSKVPQLKNLLEGMLHPNPKQRYCIKQVLSHEWFNL
ncbi:Serine/Threonine kinase domain protein (macronuclear) [Tetrahymena thermophila SB210]|uniref:Serine/Threonine kinase domain protein n=1 Tax=Tetrahymena thermophila (strain SB210) TaxID=312017 RepID=I7LY44_TETTS|nr:Serine/Threonine kinase domain protein [Tetrahymena thermophila SB210]EAS07672.1 Serine/Threonine kinase domain protein [Tetrahymena thermophila SB210]|eukprot:XP_001027914.1 Serine/Threonine kinase domain protein [Tetrahymena thermophila SB210]